MRDDWIWPIRAIRRDARATREGPHLPVALLGSSGSGHGPRGAEQFAVEAHEAWLEGLTQPVLRLDSGQSREELRDMVLGWEPDA